MNSPDIKKVSKPAVRAEPLVTCLLSIVIPTFNRRELVSAAIDSALAWGRQINNLEVIVVDDASTDGTSGAMTEKYADSVARRKLRVVTLPQNLGATGAKNIGVQLATGTWIVFLDSDDLLVESARADIVSTLERNIHAPVVFFRCVMASTKKIIGEKLGDERSISVKDYLVSWRWGECLPIVQREIHLQEPYEERLRGHEGIAYARQIKRFGNAVVSPVAARIYDNAGSDRLSTWSARIGRAGQMAEGFYIIATEFSSVIGFGGVVNNYLRWICYKGASVFAGDTYGR